jgi:hypothetical protein
MTDRELKALQIAAKSKLREIYRIERKELDRVWGDVLYRADWAMMIAQ